MRGAEELVQALGQVGQVALRGRDEHVNVDRPVSVDDPVVQTDGAMPDNLWMGLAKPRETLFAASPSTV